MEFSFEIRNDGDDIDTLIVEPWAEEFELSAHTTIEIVITADQFLTPTITVSGNYLIFFAWSGSCARVMKDGVRISSGALGIRVP